MIRHVRGEDLQRDITIEFRVAGAVDLSHAAFAIELGDLVMGQGLPDQWNYLTGLGNRFSDNAPPLYTIVDRVCQTKVGGTEAPARVQTENGMLWCAAALRSRCCEQLRYERLRCSRNVASGEPILE